MMWCLQDALPHLIGARLCGTADTVFDRVHSDTRSIQAGDLFVALKGERFDAHDYLMQAKAAGAAAVLGECGIEEAQMNGIVVPDSQVALGELAKAWRGQFALPLAAVVGSNGKTTVTQMVAAILRAHYQNGAYATQGNFNNAIGVPLTLLGLRPEHQAAVVELGMNHPGEIAYLSKIAAPTVAVVTNAQREHLAFMRTVEAVAQENGSVISTLPQNGSVILPFGDVFTDDWLKLAQTRPVSLFAESAPKHWDSTQAWFDQQRLQGVLGHAEWVDCFWKVSVHTVLGQAQFDLHIAGRHNVRNALAALATGLALGVPLEHACQGLESFVPVQGRSVTLRLQDPKHPEQAEFDKVLIDDSYNANPDSMRAAIQILASLPKPRLLIFGDMGEVGDDGAELHAEIGAYAKACGIDMLLTYGQLAQQAAFAFDASAQHIPDTKPDALLDSALAQAQKASSILVKGSHSMRMERVVQSLQTAFQVASPNVPNVPNVVPNAIPNTPNANQSEHARVQACKSAKKEGLSK